MPMHSRPTPLTETVMHSTGAYELVLSALLIGVFGYGLDRWLGTGPYLVIVFSVFGFLGASASLYYRYKNLLRVMAEDNA
ncbi:MAG: AtpZ/AtpI family protein [Acidimicrobiia bacterium]|nr:AtpZ/AtpI family protein [Acidimicrobiia bacterium]